MQSAARASLHFSPPPFTTRTTATMSSTLPDYYAFLNIPQTATPDEVRAAYRKESLKYVSRRLWHVVGVAHSRQRSRTHPDRIANATPEEKRRATERFQVRYPSCCTTHICSQSLDIAQAVADAYYVLSDPTRRREYDSLYASRPRHEKAPDADASSNFFAQFASMFGGAAAGAGATPGDRPDAENLFADAFEEVRSHL